MDPRRYEELARLFEEARSLAGEERVAFVSRACNGDLGLRKELEGLLAQHEDDENPIEPEASLRRRVLSDLASPGEDGLPERIGPFRILRRIGAGGMGTVYEAEEDQPRRRVALKVLQPAQAHGAPLRRFRREAELLGRLQHPGIAQVYRAATFDAGGGEQPYFAMELIEGVPIDAYVAQANLDVSGRLALISSVCDAIQHAHDHGIVHRDLKPDNVLIDQAGRPKVLDFGVARASEQDTLLSTMHTSQGELLGTITHMAPEQLDGDPATSGPAADVWALGVMLFQLLTDRLPYDLAGLSLTAAIQVVSNQEPARLRKFDSKLRGELETLVAKALETDMERRYVSPAALAADLRRYLDSRPITARPAGALYRATKFTRRNPALVGGSAATLLAILVGAVATILFAKRADESRELALERETGLRAMLYKSVQANLADAPWRARLQMDAVAVGERSWVWNWFARQAPLLLEPLGPQIDRRFYTSLAEFADERTLYDVVQRGDGSWQLAEIDLGDPSRVTFPLPGIDISPSHLRVREGRAYFLQADGETWGLLDKSSGTTTSYGILPDVDHPRFGPGGLSMGSRNESGPGQELVVVRSEGGRLSAESLPLDVHHFYGFSGDGRYLYHSSAEVALFQTRPLTRLGEVDRGEEPAGVAFSPGSDAMAVATAEAGLRIFDVPSLTEQARYELPEGRAYAVDWPAPGERIAVSVAGTVRVLDAATGNVLSELGFPWHSEHIGHRIDLSEDGRLLSLFAADQYRPWVVDLEAPANLGEIRVPLPDWTYLVAVSPDGDLVAYLSPPSSKIGIFDAWTGELVREFESRLPCYNYDMAGWLGFSTDGKELAYTACSGDDYLIRSRNLLTGEVRDSASRPVEELYELPSELGRMFGEVLGTKTPDMNPRIAFATDRKLLGAVDPGLPGSVARSTVTALPKTPFGELVEYLRAGSNAIGASPDGDYTALSGSYNVRVYDGQGVEVAQWQAPDSAYAYALSFSPDSELLALGSDSGRITVYETRFWNELVTIDAHDAYVFDLEWSPDGTRLFSVSGDASLKIWDAVHPIARRFQASDREERRAAARARLAQLSAELGPHRGAEALFEECEKDQERRVAARRAALEAW